MPATQKGEHVQMSVTDLEEAVEFYTTAMGMIELDRTDNIVYLGCGRDDNYDLAVQEGPSGIEHFAIRVEDEDKIVEYDECLTDAGVETQRTDRTEPSQEQGLRFKLPNGVPMELVTVEPEKYQQCVAVQHPERDSAAPLDFDHVTLHTPDPRKDAEFMRDVLDFKITEVLGTESNWVGAFVRKGDMHHDVSLFENETGGVHHIGWEFAHIDHMKNFIDRIAQAGVDLELGVNRHVAGDNIFSYFFEPGGNRFELSAEMAKTDSGTTTFTKDIEEALYAWSDDSPPETYSEGTGIVK
jgi:catechol 2,3-dioxygenase